MSAVGHKRTLRFADDCLQHTQGIDSPVRLTLLEILIGHGHSIRNMCEAENFSFAGIGKRIQSGGLHFHRKYAF